MAKYFKYFKIPFIITAVIVVICVGIRIASNGPKECTNDDSLLDHNVYNYANNLSSSQERELEEIIEKVEQQTGIDIAVVTLNESLEGLGYDGGYSSKTHDYDMWVKGYAETFGYENNMGYDYPGGSYVVFVDNIYREPSTGRVDSWMVANGTAGNLITNAEHEEILDIALADLNDYSTKDDYFKAYSKVVKLIPKYSSSASDRKSVV